MAGSQGRILKKFLTCTAIALLLFLALAVRHSARISLPTTHLEQSQTTPSTSSRDTVPSPQIQPGSSFDIPELVMIESEINTDNWSEAIERAVENVADADVPAALENLASRAGATAMEMRKLLVRRWAGRDVVAAAAWATQFPENSIRSSVLEQVAIAWANSDLASTTAWLHDLADGESKQVATLAAAYEATHTDPIAALELASQLPPARERNELLTHAVSQWATADFATAAAWAVEIPESDLRQEMLAAVAVAAAEENGPAAATFLANALAPGEIQSRAAVSITQRWSQVAPLDAADWVSQFPETPARDAAVENLVGLWVMNDSPAAANWLNTLPDGSLRTTAINAYAASVAQTDLENHAPEKVE